MKNHKTRNRHFFSLSLFVMIFFFLSCPFLPGPNCGCRDLADLQFVSSLGVPGSWYGVTYGNGIYVAVGYGPTNHVMTSTDGINWTARVAADENGWNSVVYGNGIFCRSVMGWCRPKS
jgi:hypothetical protein